MTTVVILVLMVTLLTAFVLYEGTDSVGVVAFITGVVYCISSALAFAVTASDPEVQGTPAPYYEVSSHFGLESGKEYPLELGSRFAGSSGRMEVEGGLFYTAGTGSWSPATGISVGFDAQDGRSAILEIPNSRVVYIKDPDATPSVRIDIDPSATHQGSTTPLITKGRGPCHAEFKGTFVCVPEHSEPVLRVPPLSERAGIGPVASEAFAEGAATATITLTPEQYDALLKQG